jgi:hypothetical protein
VFAASKVIRLDLPQLSGLDGRRGIALLENVLGRLTQGNRISRLDLLNLALACGNLRRKARPKQGCLGRDPAPFSRSAGLEQRAGGGKRPYRFPLQARNARQRRCGTARPRKFHDLRALNMTKNERAQAAIPHQDTRNLNCPAWFSLARGARDHKNRRELARIGRNSHGTARAFENLRGVRLSLVPCPDPRNGVLP